MVGSWAREAATGCVAPGLGAGALGGVFVAGTTVEVTGVACMGVCVFVVIVIGVCDALLWSISSDLGVVGLLVVGAGVDGTGM